MNLEQLRGALEKCVTDQETILDRAVGDDGQARELTKEENEEYEQLEKRSAELQKNIERAEKVAAAKAKVEKLNQPVNNSPTIEIVRNENHDENGEYRGFSSFGEQLSCIASAALNPHRPADKRLLECHRAASGANEDVGAEGGFAVQPDFAMQLFTNVVDAGVLAPLCTQIPTSKNSMLLTLLDETDISIGSQFGGVRSYWRAEAGTVTATKPKYRTERVEAEALEALYYVTEELLEDAPALQAFVEKGFTTAMAFQLDDAILRGDGSGKPLGILNAPALISQAKETSQAADTIQFENVNGMVDSLQGGSGVWFAHRTCFAQLRTMVIAGASSDVPVWLPAGAYGAPEQTLFGQPLRRCEHCNVLGDKGDILYLDLSKYMLLKKSGVKASESSHVAFLTSERVFKWTQRVNGLPLVNSAITDAQGSGTTSPFVTLAERA